jgi:hypothetical protein
MKLSAALEYEKLREDAASWNKVILHRDGKFYHAYDWSAWLIKQYVCNEEFQQQRGDEKLLQVSRYPSKHGEYAMLGFPLDSISKYIPAYENARKMEDSDDMEITVSIDFGDADHDTLSRMYEEWFATCQLKEKKGKGNAAITHSDGKAPVLARSGIFSILVKVLSYPVEAKTPAENIEFISQLRQDVAALL